jgi:D-arabinose 1-dehydrogenase-like Zn-dependent alcohol dehydrogenase
MIGISGLVDLAVSFARALKCESVVPTSRTPSKQDDALRLGARSSITTGYESDWASKHAESLDVIMCTVSGAGHPMATCCSS